jgi:short-subunit dehydrogenase
MGYALITGASAGLGAEFARLFAADGHSLILVARRRDRLESLARDLSKKHGIEVEVLDADLSAPGAGKKIFDAVQAKGLFVEFLVNNAGFGSNGAFSRLPLEKELQMIDLNIRVLTELTHLFLQPMLQKRSGSILNVGSTAGYQPGPFMATYYASKAHVNSFSRALSIELRGTGVSCTLLAPGATETEFAKSASLEDSRLFKMQVTATADAVARDGYRAMKKRKAIVVSGLVNKISTFFIPHLPMGIVARVAGYLNSMVSK